MGRRSANSENKRRRMLIPARAMRFPTAVRATSMPITSIRSKLTRNSVTPAMCSSPKASANANSRWLIRPSAFARTFVAPTSWSTLLNGNRVQIGMRSASWAVALFRLDISWSPEWTRRCPAPIILARRSRPTNTRRDDRCRSRPSDVSWHTSALRAGCRCRPARPSPSDDVGFRNARGITLSHSPQLETKIEDQFFNLSSCPFELDEHIRKIGLELINAFACLCLTVYQRRGGTSYRPHLLHDCPRYDAAAFHGHRPPDSNATETPRPRYACRRCARSRSRAVFSEIGQT